jgi:hypothetical protein
MKRYLKRMQNLIQEKKNSFTVKFHKELYSENFLKESLLDKKKMYILTSGRADQYYIVDIKTKNYKTILEYVNHVLFLHR